MKFIFSILCLSFLFTSCQPAADNSASEAFEKNSNTVLAVLEGFQNENLDHQAYYATDYVSLATGFGADKDSLSLDESIASDKQFMAMFDFKLLNDPVNLLPGVNADTKMTDGSVRYYGSWEVTLPATDSTEAKSAVLKLYSSFDFNEEGKIIYEQGYGDFTGIMQYLMASDHDDMDVETAEE
jgi:hypothetical protein